MENDNTGDNPRVATRRSDKDFRFGKLLGEGSFSNVYLAKEIETGKEFAIKVCVKAHIIREKKQAYVTRERDSLNILRNTKGIISLNCTFQDPTKLYFVLTYAPNGDLLKYIQRGSLSVKTTKFYAAELLLAIEGMARRNVIHRDLKPENLLLRKDMHLMIGDFGSAKILPNDYDYETAQAEIDRIRAEEELNNSDDEEERRQRPMRRQSFVGTAQYVSPEILRGNAPHFASDLWAFGCIIFQMLTGSPPFRDGSEYLIFKKILNRDYEFPDNFPNDDAKDLIEKLLKFNPQERLGANDLPELRYTTIRNHNFFKGINWDEVFKNQPPDDLEIINESNDKNKISDDLEPGLGQAQQIRLILEDDFAASSDDDDRSASQSIPSVQTNQQNQQQNDEDVSAFLINNETIIRRGIVYKRRGLFPRRRLLLLTNSPRLIYIDPTSLIQKGEIDFNRITSTEALNFKTFYVHTPNRTYNLEDTSGGALIWCEAIERARKYLGNSTAQ